MRESLVITLGSALVFIKSVLTKGVDCLVPFKNVQMN